MNFSKFLDFSKDTATEKTKEFNNYSQPLDFSNESNGNTGIIDDIKNKIDENLLDLYLKEPVTDKLLDLSLRDPLAEKVWDKVCIISRKSGQKIQKIANLQYYKSKANYGTKKKGISR